MIKRAAATDEILKSCRRLKAVRIAVCKLRDMTQEEFAHNIGVQRTALSNWEKDRLPDPIAMIRLYTWLHISPDCIYLGHLDGVPRRMADLIEREAPRYGAEFHSSGDRKGMRPELDPTISSLMDAGFCEPSVLSPTNHPLRVAAEMRPNQRKIGD